MCCDFRVYRQVIHLPTENAAFFEHSMFLKNGVHSLDARARQLEVVVPNLVLNTAVLPWWFGSWSCKICAGTKMTIADIHFRWVLRMEVGSVIKNVGVVCSRSMQSIVRDKMACKCDTKKNKKAVAIVMPIMYESENALLTRLLDSKFRGVPDGSEKTGKQWMVIVIHQALLEVNKVNGE